MKRFTTILATSVTLLALAAPAAAIPEDPEPDPNPTPTTQPSPCGTVPPGTPHYRIKLVRFRAADESGPDWAGSDEPYFVFGSVGTDGTSSTRKSVTFGDVDSGETRNFGVWDYVWGNSCWGKLAPMGIGYSIQLWEEDAGSIATYVGSQYPQVAWLGEATKRVGQATDLILGWLQDDLLGTHTATYTPTQLASRLPVVGSSFIETVYLGGGSGSADYYVDMQVARTK
jgi:hypothetical protein